jgi:signal peptidase II
VRIIWVSVVIVIVDQITKFLVKGINLEALNLRWEGLPLGSSRPIIGDFLRLTYIENPGMAFGIDVGGKLFFSVFTLLASIGIAVYLYKKRNEPFLLRLSLATILGGAVGNLIDRVFYGVIYNEGPLFFGKVVDFIDLDFFNISLFGFNISRWPVFNVADASVTIGVILLFFVRSSPQTTSAPLPSPVSTDLKRSGLDQGDSSSPS